MGRVIYGHFSDNVAGAGVLSLVAGSEDPDYPAARLVDGKLARPAKVTTTSATWLWTYPGDQRIDIVAVPMHNLDPGLSVRWQGHTADVWTSPALDVAVPIPTYREDRFPWGSWVDLTAATGYSVTGYPFWRLHIDGANTAPIAIGEIWLSATKRTLTPNVKWGVHEREDLPVIEHETLYGVRSTYALNVLHRQFVSDLETKAAGLAAVRAWWRDCRGRGRACLLIPDSDVNDAWIVQWGGRSVPLDPTLLGLEYNTIPLDFDEVGRGLPL